MSTTETEIPTDVTAPQPIRGWVVLAAPILGVMLFALLLGAVIAMYAASHGAHDLAGIRDAAMKLFRGYFVAMGISDAFYLCLFSAIWLLLPKRGPASLASYFPRPSRAAIVVAVLVGFAMAAGVGPALYFLANYFHFDLQPTPGEMMLQPKNLTQLLAVLTAGAAVAPLVEEVYFRGILLRWLRKWVWLPLAILISAAIFAVAHGRFVTHGGLAGVFVTAALAVPGIVLALFAVRTKSLWPGVIVHATYNGLLLSLSYIAPNVS